MVEVRHQHFQRGVIKDQRRTQTAIQQPFELIAQLNRHQRIEPKVKEAGAGVNPGISGQAQDTHNLAANVRFEPRLPFVTRHFRQRLAQR